MTGPVERVPLTDEQLDEWERNRDYICFDQHHWDLITSLRASRAREQELRQRIGRALARIDKAEPRQWRRVAVMRDIRAAIAGAEAGGCGC